MKRHLITSRVLCRVSFLRQTRVKEEEEEEEVVLINGSSAEYNNMGVNKQKKWRPCHRQAGKEKEREKIDLCLLCPLN